MTTSHYPINLHTLERIEEERIRGIEGKGN